MDEISFNEWRTKNAITALKIGREEQQKNKNKRILQYNLNPKLCLQCNSSILYQKKNSNKFCSHTCAAIYNNLKRGKGQKRSGQALKNIQKANKDTISKITPEQRKERDIKCRLTKIDRGLIKYPNAKFCCICNIEIWKTNKYDYCQKHYLQSDEFLQTTAHYRKNYQKGYVFNKHQNKNVYLMSSWEFKYVDYLNKNNIIWIKPKPIPYTLDNKNHYYIPDFYLPVTNEYVEIKGHMWARDRIKLENVKICNPTINLLILGKDEMKSILVT
jgi:hypothetical protein